MRKFFQNTELQAWLVVAILELRILALQVGGPMDWFTMVFALGNMAFCVWRPK